MSSNENSPLVHTENSSYYTEMSAADKVGHTSLSWHDLSVFTKPSKSTWFSKYSSLEIEILHSVCGRTNSGKFLGLLGASGAGKTTLLDCLSGVNRDRYSLTGTISVNGHEVNRQYLKNLCTYIQHNELFMETLTVKEHLTFQFLFLSGNCTRKLDVEYQVNQIIAKLALKDCANTRIGGNTIGKRISDGQRKRLSVAFALMRDSPVILLDEPTSGLDSFLAKKVVEVLKDLASAGKAVVCSIHQPSSPIATMIDEIIILAKGQVVYAGDNKSARQFFAQNGYVCPLDFNPLDFYIDCVAVSSENESMCESTLNTLCEEFKASSYFDDLWLKCIPVDLPPNATKNETHSWNLLSTVLHRSWLNIVRQTQFEVQFFESIVSALLLGLLFLHPSLNQDAIKFANGAIFMCLMVLSYQNFLGVLATFASELPLFFRENQKSLYSPTVYFIAKNIAELPLYCLLTSIYVGIFYWTMGLTPNILSFINFWFLVLLVVDCSVAVSYMVSCITNSWTLSMIFCRPVAHFLGMVGGYFISRGANIGFMTFARYISWFYYAFEALVVNQWWNVSEIKCDHDDGGLNITHASGGPCLRTGMDVIRSLDCDVNNYYSDIFYMILLSMTFRIFALAALLYRSRL